jgi:ABC-type sugar transport system ATPase subunit
MAVLGDKGAGKSSLLKIIASVLELDAGDLGIQTVYQDLALCALESTMVRLS